MARPVRRIILPLVLLVALVGVLSLSLFPAKTLFGQRDAIGASQAELDRLDAEVAALEARIAALDTPEEVERLARENYNMVMPGEEAYGILPMSLPPLDIPPGWPFTSDPAAD